MQGARHGQELLESRTNAFQNPNRSIVVWITDSFQARVAGEFPELICCRVAARANALDVTNVSLEVLRLTDSLRAKTREPIGKTGLGPRFAFPESSCEAQAVGEGIVRFTTNPATGGLVRSSPGGTPNCESMHSGYSDRKHRTDAGP
jgi:hypothetical protein